MLKPYFIALGLLFTGTSFAQVAKYGSGLDIGNNEEYLGFELLDSLILNNQLIVAGEDYSYASFNAKLEFKLLRYMNYKFGLRNYILETSPAKADLVNQFITEEDSTSEKLLKSVSSVKYMRLYKNLKKLNSKLPDSLKIKVYGVDVERTNALPLVRMSQTLPDGETEEEIPSNLRVHVEAIQGAAKYIISKGLEEFEREQEGQDTEYDDYFYRPSAFSVRESVNEFMKSYDSLKPYFEKWLGPKFERFEQAVNWLKENKEYNSYRMTAFEFSWREDLMFHRINDIVGKGSDGDKYFVQLGLCRASNAIVSRGCGIDRFNGVVYRLKNLPESRVKSMANIGIFYNKELEVADEEYMDYQHKLYMDDLTKLFESVENSTAMVADISKSTELTSIQKDFNILLLNNNFALADEDAEADSTAIETPLADYESAYLKDYNNSRVYLGYNQSVPLISVKGLNEQLVLGGLNPVNNFRFIGGDVCVASEDRSMFRLFAGNLVSSSSNYSGSMAGFEAGSSLIFTKFVKFGFVSGFKYIRHTITEYSNSTSTTFFPEYVAPKVYKNPALVYNIGADLYVDFAPFYIFAHAGRDYDWGKSGWKFEGKSSGSLGGLDNTAWYYGYGFGLAVPIKWID
ncbi:MAG: hypothetical protein IT244_04885 [Bacteroidia bacterium]|nr:hypothetical protein [Bacteroidia bacterium]